MHHRTGGSPFISRKSPWLNSQASKDLLLRLNLVPLWDIIDHRPSLTAASSPAVATA